MWVHAMQHDIPGRQANPYNALQSIHVTVPALPELRVCRIHWLLIAYAVINQLSQVKSGQGRVEWR